MTTPTTPDCAPMNHRPGTHGQFATGIALILLAVALTARLAGLDLDGKVVLAAILGILGVVLVAEPLLRRPRQRSTEPSGS